MEVAADYICEHGMPQPWATCTECMLLPRDQQPLWRPPPAPAKPVATKRPATRRAAKKRTPTAKRKPGIAPSNTRKTAARKSPTSLPRSVDDDAPELFGDKDLAYEIPEANLRYHVQGSDKDWLAISAMPTELRPGGVIYLKTDDRLVASRRVKGIGFRDRRWSHEAPEATSDAGPGPTLELDGNDWQMLSLAVAPDSNDESRGYRYLITESDGSVSPA